MPADPFEHAIERYNDHEMQREAIQHDHPNNPHHRNDHPDHSGHLRKESKATIFSSESKGGPRRRPVPPTELLLKGAYVPSEGGPRTRRRNTGASYRQHRDNESKTPQTARDSRDQRRLQPGGGSGEVDYSTPHTTPHTHTSHHTPHHTPVYTCYWDPYHHLLDPYHHLLL